jgi:hypothetical protein
MTTPSQQQQPRPASEWEDYFKKAGVLIEKLDAAKSQKSKSTIIGSFLTRNVDRVVTIEHAGRQMQAKLRAFGERANGKTYAFEVALGENCDDPVGASFGTATEAAPLTTQLNPDCEQELEAPSVEPATGAPSGPPGDDQGGDPRSNNEVW